MTADRIRLTVLADELGIDFPGLFSEFCRQCPKVIDNDLTVPVAWLRVLKYAQSQREEVA